LTSYEDDEATRLEQRLAETLLPIFDAPPLLPVAERVRAGLHLDLLGDPRPSLDLTKPDYWTQPIAPGPFVMGKKEKSFVYQITRPYALARFPVTNRQYLLFVEALVGRGPAKAVEAARSLLALLQQHQQTAKQLHPRYWPGACYRAGAGNHPVVGVTWYAATAFAWWVDAWLHAEGLLQDDEAIRLPTEPEWERAAADPLSPPSIPCLRGMPPPLIPPASRGMICQGGRPACWAACIPLGRLARCNENDWWHEKRGHSGKHKGERHRRHIGRGALSARCGGLRRRGADRQCLGVVQYRRSGISAAGGSCRRKY
jgi:hypothetical protein